MYGHDSFGLGHLRRNLALAHSLSQLACRPDQLIVTGTAEACAFDLPARTDLLQVPSVTKDRAGRYRTGRLSADLAVVMSMRRAALDGALVAFAPDLVVVDKVAFGLGGELADALRNIRARHGTRIVLGLRDVLDSPLKARREWDDSATGAAVRSIFDEVWVYGDPSVYDVVRECGLVEVSDMVRYCGYLSAGRPDVRARPPGVAGAAGYVVCTVGGGADGMRTAGTFIDSPMPPGVIGVMVTGPHMPEAERVALERRASARRDMIVVASSPHVAGWLRDASAVVSMGGYNTLSEILATSTPALVVPRTVPRMEQAIRARAFAERGLVDVMEPSLVDPHSMGRWMASAVHRRGVDRSGVDLEALRRVRSLAEALLAKETASALAV